jgi:hypothetical protein
MRMAKMVLTKLPNLRQFAAVAFLTALLWIHPRAAEAGGGFSKEIVTDEGLSEELGTGKFSSFPFHVSVSVRGGYDDNVNRSTFDTQESWFTSASVGLNYEFGSPRTRVTLTSGAGVTYYFDRDDDEFAGDFDDYDFNVFVGASITHKATPRLTLSANLYASYQSQPDFQSFNASTISINRQSQDFFFSVNRFSVAYLWTPRFSTNTSYTLGIINYDNAVVSRFEDRLEHTIGNEFRFLVWPTTTVIGEYRFGMVDYTDNDDRSSTSHFLLAGFDHSFSPRFNMSARAGVEFRNYDDDFTGGRVEGSRTHPYAESTLNYAIAQRTSISWTNRYSLEQPDVPEAFSRSTYRTSISLKHNFTARITAGLNVAYQHDENDGSFGIGGFSEDAIDIWLSVRYAINRNFAIDAGYQRTEVFSDEALFREFSRNRYYVGGTFTF